MATTHPSKEIIKITIAIKIVAKIENIGTKEKSIRPGTKGRRFHESAESKTYAHHWLLKTSINSE